MNKNMFASHTTRHPTVLALDGVLIEARMTYALVVVASTETKEMILE